MIDILEKKDCCGCSACISICPKSAISFQEDDEGFFYPIVDEDKCVDCTLCNKVCPVMEYDSISNKEHDPISIYALSNKNKEVLSASSSGGVFDAIANEIIHKGGVVFGCAYSDNMEVRHIRVDSPNQIFKLRGSKYVQSDIRNIFQQVKTDLRTGKKVLFVGTPCQVEGLKLYLRKNHENLVTIDFVCHGVPSPKMYREYINMLEADYGHKVVDIKMRDKTRGWKQRFHFRVTFDNGTSKFDTRRTNLWNKIFFSENVTRPSCHTCRFTNYLRPGDLTISDFWGVYKYYPCIASSDGVSLSLINTDKGDELIKSIKDQFVIQEVEKEKSFQPCLANPTSTSNEREHYWNYYKTHGFISLSKRFHHFGLLDYYFTLWRYEFKIWRMNHL